MKPQLLHIGLFVMLLGAFGCALEPDASSEGESHRATETFTRGERDSDATESADGELVPPQSEPQLASGETATTDSPASAVPVNARPVHRMSYPRPEISEQALRRNGLMRFRLKYLDLITDLTPDLYESLLPLPDAMMATWEDFFGELPPAVDGSEYRVTGYLMRDRELFLAAGLVKEDTLLSYHGRQIGAEFWLNDQSWDYYRRHLLLHEATHAFMRHLPGEATDLPLWYLEGMAEMLATHRLADDGTVEFNVMPTDRSRFHGFERIAIVQRDVKANGVRPLSAITRFSAEDFTKVESYAWCWALCRFLDSHPKYRDRFRKIARELTAVPFRQNMATLFAPDMKRLQTEWLLFAANVVHGFDFERAQIEFRDGRPITGKGETTVRSDVGWQSSEILVEAGKRYLVTATGQFTLADSPKPWVSEADGISLQYIGGLPIGRLPGAVLADEGDSSTRALSMLEEVPIGNRAEFVALASGTLYLRVNDDWGSLADNRGLFRVTIQKAD